MSLIYVGNLLDYIKKYHPDKHFEEAALYTNMYVMSKTGKELQTIVFHKLLRGSD